MGVTYSRSGRKRAHITDDEREEFAAMVRGRMIDRDDFRLEMLALICEVTRLREALDDIAMGAPRRRAFEALGERHAAVDLSWLRAFQGYQGIGDSKQDKV